MKKIVTSLLVLILFTLPFYSCNFDEQEGKIVCTLFPQYDFARRIAGDKLEVVLLKSTGDVHSYEPTSEDIKAISGSAAFLYIGGESDEWVDKVLGGMDKDINAVPLIGCVDRNVTYDHHGEEETDEHIWTSVKNALLMAGKIYDTICEIDPDNKEYYSENINSLEAELESLDKKFSDLSKKLGDKYIVLGSSNPFLYMADAYGLNIMSPYEACGHESEPNTSMLTEIIDIVKDKNIKTVFCVDESDTKLAKTIAEPTYAEICRLYSCHTLTSAQLSGGETYLTLMEKNIDALSHLE